MISIFFFDLVPCLGHEIKRICIPFRPFTSLYIIIDALFSYRKTAAIINIHLDGKKTVDVFRNVTGEKNFTAYRLLEERSCFGIYLYVESLAVSRLKTLPVINIYLVCIDYCVKLAIYFDDIQKIAYNSGFSITVAVAVAIARFRFGFGFRFRFRIESFLDMLKY